MIHLKKALFLYLTLWFSLSLASFPFDNNNQYPKDFSTPSCSQNKNESDNDEDAYAGQPQFINITDLESTITRMLKRQGITAPLPPALALDFIHQEARRAQGMEPRANYAVDPTEINYSELMSSANLAFSQASGSSIQLPVEHSLSHPPEASGNVVHPEMWRDLESTIPTLNLENHTQQIYAGPSTSSMYPEQDRFLNQNVQRQPRSEVNQAVGAPSLYFNSIPMNSETNYNVGIMQNSENEGTNYSEEREILGVQMQHREQEPRFTYSVPLGSRTQSTQRTSFAYKSSEETESSEDSDDESEDSDVDDDDSVIASSDTDSSPASSQDEWEDLREEPWDLSFQGPPEALLGESSEEDDGSQDSWANDPPHILDSSEEEEHEEMEQQEENLEEDMDEDEDILILEAELPPQPNPPEEPHDIFALLLPELERVLNWCPRHLYGRHCRRLTCRHRRRHNHNSPRCARFRALLLAALRDPSRPLCIHRSVA